MKLTDFLDEVGRPVAYYPKLRRLTGSTNATMLLCQFIYWRGKEISEGGWLYKTAEDIEDETGLSYEEQRTARKRLKSLELIEEKYDRLNHRMYFRLNIKEINRQWMNTRTRETQVPELGNAQFGNKALPCSLNSNTEITTEITTEIVQNASRFDSAENQPEKLASKQKRKLTPAPERVNLYRSVTHKFPNKIIYDEVDKKIAQVESRLGRSATTTDLVQFYKSWVSRGYNPGAITWIDWAISGIIPQYQSKKENLSNGTNQDVSKQLLPTEAERSAFAEYARKRKAEAALP